MSFLLLSLWINPSPKNKHYLIKPAFQSLEDRLPFTRQTAESKSYRATHIFSDGIGFFNPPPRLLIDSIFGMSAALVLLQRRIKSGCSLSHFSPGLILGPQMNAAKINGPFLPSPLIFSNPLSPSIPIVFNFCELTLCGSGIRK